MATLSYSAATTITIGLATTPLASSATFVAGRSSAEIDNTTNLYQDALVEGLVTVGTTPTINTQVLVYVWGSYVSTVTTALDTIVGTDADKTLTSAGVRDGFMRLGGIGTVDATTSNRGYYIGPFSVAQLFGGDMPPFWGLFIVHNTGAALNSTAGNHVWKYTGVKY